jgi:hypothetical protein
MTPLTEMQIATATVNVNAIDSNNNCLCELGNGDLCVINRVNLRFWESVEKIEPNKPEANNDKKNIMNGITARMNRRERELQSCIEDQEWDKCSRLESQIFELEAILVDLK